MAKIKKGDEVIVIAGKDKGRRGEVCARDGRGQSRGHQHQYRQETPEAESEHEHPGGIIEREMPLDASNVMLYNPITKKGDRVGFKNLEDGRKVRIFKSNKEVVDV